MLNLRTCLLSCLHFFFCPVPIPVSCAGCIAYSNSVTCSCPPSQSVQFQHPLTQHLCRAGGGGKSNHRKAKIEAKNKKLAEERQNNLHKEKERKAQPEEAEDNFAGVHPSRRNRLG